MSIRPLYIAGSVASPSGPFQGSRSFWTIPWILIGIIVALTLLVVGWLRQRRRRRRTRDTTAGPQKPGGETASGNRNHQLAMVPSRTNLEPKAGGHDTPAREPTPVASAEQKAVRSQMNIRWWLKTVALASAVIGGVFAVPATAFASGFKVPFTDSYQVGSLTLCNSHEQPITSGSLSSDPFVWRAVSSARAPVGYTRATLYLFQPLQYIDPGDWTGYELTEDSLFSNPAHPMAQATYADGPLSWPDHSMPPYWDGLYELRLFFSAPDKMPITASYPAAVIKVTGKTWTLVRGVDRPAPTARPYRWSHSSSPNRPQRYPSCRPRRRRADRKGDLRPRLLPRLLLGARRRPPLPAAAPLGWP